jgi:transposase
VVVIDPHAGYAAAVRAVLPEARIAVDHFHLIMLANKAVTAVRQRVTRDLLDAAAARPTPRGPTGGCCCAAGAAV